MNRNSDRPEIVTTTEARSGVTGHNVRYVLVLGIVGAVAAFVLAWVTAMYIL